MMGGMGGGGVDGMGAGLEGYQNWNLENRLILRLIL